MTAADSRDQGGTWLCASDGGVSVPGNHRCECMMQPQHEGRHGCHCGAMWACLDCPESDPDGCAGCGANGDLTTAPPADEAREGLAEGVSQTILAAPELVEQGVYGNCMQAAIATALGKPLDAVPHFGAFTWWPGALRLWLRGEGLDYTIVTAPPIPDERAMLVGKSPRGYSHAVVSEGGKIVWDPHPSRDGLVEVKGAYLIHEWNTEIVPGEDAYVSPAEHERQVSEARAAALREYADWCMAEVAMWDERVYPNRWDNARDRANHARSRADTIATTQDTPSRPEQRQAAYDHTHGMNSPTRMGAADDPTGYWLCIDCGWRSDRAARIARAGTEDGEAGT